MSSSGLPARRDAARHLAHIALVHVGIVATFAAIGLIACVIRLLIWLWLIKEKLSEFFWWMLRSGHNGNPR